MITRKKSLKTFLDYKTLTEIRISLNVLTLISIGTITLILLMVKNEGLIHWNRAFILYLIPFGLFTYSVYLRGICESRR